MPAKANHFYTLPVPPSSNRWWRKWNNRMVLSNEARDYKKMVAALAEVPPLDGPICVELIWRRTAKRGDLDKRIGVLLDALQGVAYRNDKQIYELSAKLIDTKDRDDVEVWVWPVGSR